MVSYFVTVRGEISDSLVESVSITSIFPPYSSDTESETSSESNESPRRFSFSIETFFSPHRSPSHSDSSKNYEEIFPIDPFISTSSTRTLPTLVSMMFDGGVQVPNCTNPLSRNQLSHTAPQAKQLNRSLQSEKMDDSDASVVCSSGIDVVF